MDIGTAEPERLPEGARQAVDSRRDEDGTGSPASTRLDQDNREEDEDLDPDADSESSGSEDGSRSLLFDSESEVKSMLNWSLDAMTEEVIKAVEPDQQLAEINISIDESVLGSDMDKQATDCSRFMSPETRMRRYTSTASVYVQGQRQRVSDPRVPVHRVEAAPKPCFNDLSQDDQIKYHAFMALATLPASLFKVCARSPDAFSDNAKWLVEADYAAWSSNQHVRLLMSVKPNSSIPGTDGHTIGPESVDSNGCASLFSFIFSIIDSRASYVGFDNARIDWNNAVKRMAAHFAAENAVGRISKLIRDVTTDTSFKGDLRDVLLTDLNVMHAEADKRSSAALHAAGSLADKRLAYFARTAGGSRDAVVQPVQGVTNLTAFSLKTVAADAVSSTKGFLKSIISAIGKFSSVLGMLAGLLQSVQGAYDTHAANNRSKRISVTKKRFRTAAENMGKTRGTAANFIDELGEQIYAHGEAERTTRRHTNRWDRAGGIVRTVYGTLLISCAVLSLAVPFIMPIMVIANLLFTFAYIGWTAVRVSVLRHRNKRLDKDKVRIQREFDLIMKIEKPKAEEQAKNNAVGMKDFWRNKAYLNNRLFALEAARHYLTAEADYDASGVDGNGLTKEDRDALKLLLTEMGVPAESFARAGTLASNLAFHLIEDGAFKPADETPVQQAIQLLGKGDIARRTQGMNFLESRIETVVDRQATEQKADIRGKCEAAIKKAFQAGTRAESKEAMRELRELFVVPEPRPVSQDGESASGANPSRIRARSKGASQATPSQDDQILVRPAALDEYLATLGDKADGEAATVLSKKLRGYPVKRVMHNLKCFSGSMFSTGKQSARFDRVSSAVAQIALDECLLVGKNNDLSGAQNAKRRAQIVEFCTYAAQQDGMVSFGVFNHQVHPDFASLTSAIEGLIDGKADCRWLLKAIDAWPVDKDDNAGRQQFWSSMKIALLRHRTENVGMGLAKALKSDPKSAGTALEWLLPEASKLFGDWEKNAAGKTKEVAQHIECMLGIRQYARGAFDWVGEENSDLKPRTLSQSFDDLVRKATSHDGIGAITDFMADTPLEEKDLNDIVNAIVDAKYAHSREQALDEKKASAKADLKARIDLYFGVLQKHRWVARAARLGHWLMPTWIAEWINKREAAIRSFITDDLAAFLDKPYLAGHHPMPPGFASSLKKLGNKHPDMALNFMRTHYSLLGTDANSRHLGKGAEQEFLSLRKMAKKLAEWADRNPSLGDLYLSLQSTAEVDRMAAAYYLRQQGLSADQVQQVEAACNGNDRKGFDTALYQLLYRHQWQHERIQQIIAPAADASNNPIPAASDSALESALAA
jgi:hypothetical protein